MEAERPVEDHVYVFTIAGRCLRCQRTPDEHVALMQTKVPGECDIDHSSMTAAQLIGDGGWEWRRCPFCRTMVEPKLAGEGPSGPKYDRGRGDLTERMKKRLRGWAGWLDFNGGDR